MVLILLSLLLLAFEQMNYRTRQASKLTFDSWLNRQVEDSWTSELKMALSDPEICFNFLKNYSPSVNNENTNTTLPNGLLSIQKINITGLRIVDDLTPHQILIAKIKILEIDWSRTDSVTQRYRSQKFPILVEGTNGPGLLSCRGTWFVEKQIAEEYICKRFGKVYQYGSLAKNDQCIVQP